MRLFSSEWRDRLQPASYNGAAFKVDVNTRAGGRRIALHEFPKKDIPYAEDMGRKARRFSVAAYVIGGNFVTQRDELIAALETEGSGQLILPTSLSVDDQTVVVDTYTITERRERGGIAEFEINFIQAGQDPSLTAQTDTQSAVTGSVNNATGNQTGGVFDNLQPGVSFLQSSDLASGFSG